MTNGEMIMRVLNKKYEDFIIWPFNKGVVKSKPNNDYEMQFSIDWWNAEYQGLFPLMCDEGIEVAKRELSRIY